MSANKNESKSGDKVSPARGKQAELIAETSDEKQSHRSLARDRQSKPKDSKQLKRALKDDPKQSKRKS